MQVASIIKFESVEVPTTVPAAGRVLLECKLQPLFPPTTVETFVSINSRPVRLAVLEVQLVISLVMSLIWAPVDVFPGKYK